MKSTTSHPPIYAVATILLIGLPTLPACSTATIAAKEAFGYAKREQLVDRVEDARDAQGQAKQQFASALEQFLSVTGVGSGGGSASTKDLEARYAKLKDGLATSEKRATAVRSRITDTKNVADALFEEWNRELGQYSSPAMKQASQRQLDDTKRQYERLIGAMDDAAAKMDPVLAAFRDQVLFLKHNLNARAIASLQSTSDQLGADVAALIKEMEASIAEADSFIAAMKPG
jgi:Skp family chaperone for outer membrane proteins